MKNEVNHTLGVKKNSLYYLLIVSIILSLTCAPVVSYAMPEPVPATQTDKQKAAAAKKKEAEKKKKEAEKAKAAKEKQKAAAAKKKETEKKKAEAEKKRAQQAKATEQKKAEAEKQRAQQAKVNEQKKAEAEKQRAQQAKANEQKKAEAAKAQAKAQEQREKEVAERAACRLRSALVHDGHGLRRRRLCRRAGRRVVYGRCAVGGLEADHQRHECGDVLSGRHLHPRPDGHVPLARQLRQAGARQYAVYGCAEGRLLPQRGALGGQ